MNNFLHDNLFAIILFLLLIILLLIALIGIVLIKLLLKPNSKEAAPPPKGNSSELLEPIVDTPKSIKRLAEEPVVEKFFCTNHSEIASTGSCLICEEVFCEKCLIEHDSLYFCKEHFKIFANGKWKQITDVKTTPNTPDEGLFIYHFKRQIWREKETPSFVLTHYKINIEEDYIESYIQLNVLENDAERLSSEIEKYKAR